MNFHLNSTFMKLPTRFIVVICSVATLYISCTKRHDLPVSCSPVLYGNKIFLNQDSVFTFATINPTTATITAGTDFADRLSLNLNPQGAFNTSDNCYYILSLSISAGSSPNYMLNKIAPGGVATSYTTLVTANGYSALVYNRPANKLCCVKGTAGGTAKIVELTISGSAFSETVLATTTYSAFSEMTVDNTSGTMYLESWNGTAYYIEKYSLGAPSTSIVTMVPGLIALRFNANDHMLYAIKDNASTSLSSFIKINPGTGAVTTLSSLSYAVNSDFYSASIDPCNNRYILSTLSDGDTTAILDAYDMSGTIISHVTTSSYIFMGLDFKY
jgi:hypothetical protein